MLRRPTFFLIITGIAKIIFFVSVSAQSFAQDWEVRKARGTLKVVDLWIPSVSVLWNCTEGLVTTDTNNNLIPGLAEDWRWINDQTIEFRLRKGVIFHNGEEFNAEAAKVNWRQYRKMKTPTAITLVNLDDATEFQVVDAYTVR